MRAENASSGYSGLFYKVSFSILNFPISIGNSTSLYLHIILSSIILFISHVVKGDKNMEVEVHNTHLNKDVITHELKIQKEIAYRAHLFNMQQKISWIRAKTIQISGTKSSPSNNQNQWAERACYSTNFAKAIMHFVYFV